MLRLKAGDTVADRYEIIGKLGDGGFSEVFHALDTLREPALDVALKLFHLPDDDEELELRVALLKREARELAMVDHVNIVKMLQFGVAEGEYYMALEYLNGETLWDLVEREGPLPEPMLAFVGRQIVHALAHLSGLLIVHRDISPGNIVVVNTGDVKLLDFGLAKSIGGALLTQTNVFKGTPEYVSPEYVVANTEMDIRSDVYSLGATLYYAATQTPPFSGATLFDTLESRFKTRPAPLKKKNPNLSSAMVKLIERMLAFRREKRPTLEQLDEHFAALAGR